MEYSEICEVLGALRHSGFMVVRYADVDHVDLYNHLDQSLRPDNRAVGTSSDDLQRLARLISTIADDLPDIVRAQSGATPSERIGRAGTKAGFRDYLISALEELNHDTPKVNQQRSTGHEITFPPLSH